MCTTHLPLKFVGKASQERTQYTIFITTGKLLVRQDSYLPKILQLNFFLFAILISIIFVKVFKRVKKSNI